MFPHEVEIYEVLIVWICDFDKDRLCKLGLELPEAKQTQDDQDIFNDPDIDLVCIASYDEFHHQQVVMALKKGKHVYVEKPICLKKDELNKHIEAGTKRVIVSRTPKDTIDRMVIHGINEDSIEESDQIKSATSSTTQAFGLMLRILDDHFSVKIAMMTTVHAYTADQPLTDAIGIDLRRSRSAVENIIPNTTNAPKIIEKLMPEFKGKLDGIAFNVPVPNGSCVDMTTELEKVPSPEELNGVLEDASNNKYKNFIGYTDDPIVSSDVIGREETIVFDGKATMVTGNNLLKTLCWYDNGWGFSKRILDTIKTYHKDVR